MQGIDLHAYQLYQQLLSGEAHARAGTGGQEGAAMAFFPPPPPPLGGHGGVHDQWLIDPAEYGDGFVPGGHGDWAGSSGDDSMTLGGHVFAGNDVQLGHGAGVPGVAGGVQEEEEEFLVHGVDLIRELMDDEAASPRRVDVFAGNDDQLAHGAADDSMVFRGDVLFAGNGDQLAQEELLTNGVDLRELMGGEATSSMWVSAMMDSMAADHPSGTSYAPPPMGPAPAAEPSQPASGSSGPSTQLGAADSPGMMSQMPAYLPAMDYPLQMVPDDEDAEVAHMVRVAARCDDQASTAWSEEENQVLRQGLSRFAGQDSVTKCFNIAFGLANKTALDVAYRIRWLSDLEKKRAARQAQLEAEKSAEAKVTKGKGTRSATRKNNKYPLSKEVLNSKSAKELIRDNARLMDKIEENLRKGQVKNSPDYFYYIKMNMDALQNKVTGLSTVLEGLSVGNEEWEDVLKDRSSSA